MKNPSEKNISTDLEDLKNDKINDQPEHSQLSENLDTIIKEKETLDKKISEKTETLEKTKSDLQNLKANPKIQSRLANQIHLLIDNYKMN